MGMSIKNAHFQGTFLYGGDKEAVDPIEPDQTDRWI